MTKLLIIQFFNLINSTFFIKSLCNKGWFGVPCKDSFYHLALLEYGYFTLLCNNCSVTMFNSSLYQNVILTAESTSLRVQLSMNLSWLALVHFMLLIFHYSLFQLSKHFSAVNIISSYHRFCYCFCGHLN